MNYNKQVRDKIFELADEEYKKFHSKLCPDVDNIVGVRTPKLREYAKQLSKQDWKQYLQNAQDQYYEETLLQGMVIGNIKENIEVLIPYIEKFIPKINNWAICDCFCAGLKITKKNLEYMWGFIKPYLESNQEFEVRFAVVMILDYYVTDKYIFEVLNILNNIKHEGYYVKMAVAWAISTCYIKFNEITMKMLENNNLDDFTYNKSIQKIIESYRISESEKILLKKIKRK